MSGSSENEPNTSEDEERHPPGFFMKSTIASLGLQFPTVQNIETSQLDDWLKSSNERTVILLVRTLLYNFIV